MFVALKLRHQTILWVLKISAIRVQILRMQNTATRWSFYCTGDKSNYKEKVSKTWIWAGWWKPLQYWRQYFCSSVTSGAMPLRWQRWTAAFGIVIKRLQQEQSSPIACTDGTRRNPVTLLQQLVAAEQMPWIGSTLWLCKEKKGKKPVHETITVWNNHCLFHPKLRVFFLNPVFGCQNTT